MELDKEYFDLEFEGEVGLFEAFLNDMEGFLVSEITTLKEQIKDAVILDKELVNTELQVVGHHFPNILRKSFLVSLYSFLEHWLLEQCYSRKGDEISVNPLDVRGENSIDRARVYLTKILRIDFPVDSPEWAEIQNIRRLRNCIVHDNGRCDQDKHAKLRNYVAQSSPILFLSNNEVVVSSEYCQRAISTIGDFIKLLSLADNSPSNKT